MHIKDRLFVNGKEWVDISDNNFHCIWKYLTSNKSFLSQWKNAKNRIFFYRKIINVISFGLTGKNKGF